MATLRFDPACNSIDAVQRAAYRSLADTAADISLVDGQIVCILHMRPGIDPNQLLHDFRVEVLDQTLRERIRAETEATRNLILSIAFAHVALDDDAR